MFKTKYPLTISSALNLSHNFLNKARIPSARLEAELLLAHLLKSDLSASRRPSGQADRTDLYRNSDRLLSERQTRRLKIMLRKRARHWPLAYLTGQKEFMGMFFLVNQSVLIPRPETELLVETALQLLQGQKKHIILDIGTGSGNIAVALARLSGNKKLKIFASDISAGALKIARQNARLHQIAKQITFYRGDLFAAFKKFNLYKKVDLIISNPPYISNRERRNLPLDVRKYEPAVALYAGQNGDSFHKKIISESVQYLKAGGYLLMEIGIGRAPELEEFLANTGCFSKITVHNDYNRIPRVISAKFMR